VGAEEGLKRYRPGGAVRRAPPISDRTLVDPRDLTVHARVPGYATYTGPPVQVSLDPSPAQDSGAGLLCVGVFDGASPPEWLREAPGAADVRTSFKKLTMLRPPSPERVLVIGLGPVGDFDSERARVAASLGVRQAQRYGASELAWQVPGGAPIAAAITGGTILTAYRFNSLKSERGDDDENEGAGPVELILHGADGADELVAVARVAAIAANRARDLQNLPANIADPDYMAARAAEIAAGSEAIEVEVLGPEQLAGLGMGGLISVGNGSAKDPLLIVLRYTGQPEADPLGIVGKAVTFDSGGISLKPSASMHEMKMDMSGGAAALEATAAIAELGLELNLLTVVPAVENMPSGSATRPGDVITQLNGKTVEINNTDAEGRLILADALTWCAREGATQIVDLATLTGAVVVALGSTHAAVIGNDDALVGAVEQAGATVGELVWRLPLHAEYKELMKGTVADLTNAAPKRKAGSITAAAFLEEFIEDARWAHIDIAGTAWDVGRPYLGRGASGYGVRLLVELARSFAESRETT
jgi:leucyl aminopeptidase